MANTLVFLVLLSPVKSLIVQDLRMYDLLLPNVDNLISPFVIKPQNDQENETEYEIRVKCSKFMKEYVEFNSEEGNVCTKETLVGSVNSINDFLSKASVKLSPKAQQGQDLSIDYTFLDTNYKNGKVPQSYVQTFEAPSLIPTTTVNTSIKYQSDSTAAFNLKILEIDALYYKKSNNSSISIAMNENVLPAWIKPTLTDNALYFSGEAPDSISDDFTFRFRLQDTLTGLSSDEVDIAVQNAAQSEDPAVKAIVLMLLAVMSLMAVGFVTCILLKTQERGSNGLATKDERNIHLQETKKNSNGNILSDSILEWNKKLVVKRKERADTCLEALDIEKEPKTPNFYYDQFEHSFCFEEDPEIDDFGNADKLSDIRPDKWAKTNSYMNRSSFLKDH